MTEDGEPRIEDIQTLLKGIMDPEMFISIVDLGLVYETRLSPGGEVFIRYTLTSPGCPLAPMIEEQIRATVGRLPGVSAIHIELTFDPPWDLRSMASEEAKDQLGIW